MSAIQFELPDSVHERALELARQTSMTLDRLMLVALVEKLSTMFPDEALEERAPRGNWQAYDEFMKGIPDTEPLAYDRWPESSTPEK